VFDFILFYLVAAFLQHVRQKTVAHFPCSIDFEQICVKTSSLIRLRRMILDLHINVVVVVVVIIIIIPVLAHFLYFHIDVSKLIVLSCLSKDDNSNTAIFHSEALW
jgi:hypothetical protein